MNIFPNFILTAFLHLFPVGPLPTFHQWQSTNYPLMLDKSFVYWFPYFLHFLCSLKFAWNLVTIPFNFKVFCALWIFNSFKFLTIFNNLKLNLSLKVLIDFNFYLVWEASKIFTFLKKLQYPVLAKYLDQIQIFFQIYVILQLDDRSLLQD